MSCWHKSTHDFSERGIDGRLVWRCSHCGRRERWGDAWRYWGTLECGDGMSVGCGLPKIQWVACSEACANAQRTVP
jgi:hypothetical protein